MLINQELLRTFLVAAETETFGEAARRRHVTKSAISQQIKALEGQLGTALFERVGRHARLTGAGQRLAEVLRPHLEAIDDALATVRATGREVEGEIRIGAPRPFARHWLRPRLVGLLAEHPRLQATVVFGTPTQLERQLVERGLDLALLVRSTELPTLEVTPVYTETFMAHAAPTYLREHGTPATLDELAEHRFIVFDDDLPMHAPWWRATFGPRAGLRGEVVARIASLDEMLALAEAGLGIAVLPDYVTAPARERGTVRALGLGAKRPPARNRITLAWRRSVVPTATFEAVREALGR